MKPPKRVNFYAIISHIPGGEKEALLRMEHDESGFWVSHDDYEKLKNRCDRTHRYLMEEWSEVLELIDENIEKQKEIDWLKSQVKTIEFTPTKGFPVSTWVPASDYEKLKAENKRLRKAGGNLHAFLTNLIGDQRIESVSLDRLDNDWREAAREHSR